MFQDYRVFIFSVKSQCTVLGVTIQIKARILIFPGTDFRFPSTSVPPGTFFKALYYVLVGGVAQWHSGRTSVSGRRTFPVLRSTCS